PPLTIIEVESSSKPLELFIVSKQESTCLPPSVCVATMLFISIVDFGSSMVRSEPPLTIIEVESSSKPLELLLVSEQESTCLPPSVCVATMLFIAIVDFGSSMVRSEPPLTMIEVESSSKPLELLLVSEQESTCLPPSVCVATMLF
ncbi:hypothetical protein KSS87_020460, partial [Heliosperma pusillum]